MKKYKNVLSVVVIGCAVVFSAVGMERGLTEPFMGGGAEEDEQRYSGMSLEQIQEEIRRQQGAGQGLGASQLGLQEKNSSTQQNISQLLAAKSALPIPTKEELNEEYRKLSKNKPKSDNKPEWYKWLNAKSHLNGLIVERNQKDEILRKEEKQQAAARVQPKKTIIAQKPAKKQNQLSNALEELTPQKISTLSIDKVDQKISQIQNLWDRPAIQSSVSAKKQQLMKDTLFDLLARKANLEMQEEEAFFTLLQSLTPEVIKQLSLDVVKEQIKKIEQAYNRELPIPENAAGIKFALEVRKNVLEMEAGDGEENEKVEQQAVTQTGSSLFKNEGRNDAEIKLQNKIDKEAQYIIAKIKEKQGQPEEFLEKWGDYRSPREKLISRSQSIMDKANDAQKTSFDTGNLYGQKAELLPWYQAMYSVIEFVVKALDGNIRCHNKPTIISSLNGVMEDCKKLIFSFEETFDPSTFKARMDMLDSIYANTWISSIARLKGSMITFKNSNDLEDVKCYEAVNLLAAISVNIKEIVKKAKEDLSIFAIREMLKDRNTARELESDLANLEHQKVRGLPQQEYLNLTIKDIKTRLEMLNLLPSTLALFETPEQGISDLKLAIGFLEEYLPIKEQYDPLKVITNPESKLYEEIINLLKRDIISLNEMMQLDPKAIMPFNHFNDLASKIEGLNRLPSSDKVKPQIDDMIRSYYQRIQKDTNTLIDQVIHADGAFIGIVFKTELTGVINNYFKNELLKLYKEQVMAAIAKKEKIAQWQQNKSELEKEVARKKTAEESINKEAPVVEAKIEEWKQNREDLLKQKIESEKEKEEVLREQDEARKKVAELEGDEKRMLERQADVDAQIRDMKSREIRLAEEREVKEAQMKAEKLEREKKRKEEIKVASSSMLDLWAKTPEEVAAERTKIEKEILDKLQQSEAEEARQKEEQVAEKYLQTIATTPSAMLDESYKKIVEEPNKDILQEPTNPLSRAYESARQWANSWWSYFTGR